jgi:hypothetical protein
LGSHCLTGYRKYHVRVLVRQGQYAFDFAETYKEAVDVFVIIPTLAWCYAGDGEIDT